MFNVAERLAGVEIRSNAYINGRPTLSRSGRTFAKISPIDGSTIAQVSFSEAADVDLAVASARSAFESGTWSTAAPKHRKKVLLRFAALMEQHAGELALLETADVGKPIKFSTAVDIPGAIDAVRWYAELIDKVYDAVAPLSHDKLAILAREPIGVVAAIVPWNFPLLMASWKFAPALAAGNSVILKPAEQSPLTALRIAELASEAGVPDGVFNVLPGDGPVTGQALARHMDVDAVAFTGSTEVGKLFMRYSGESNLKTVSLECGGKSPLIVFDDVQNLDAAAKALAMGIFFNQGQVCNASSRLLVHESVKEPLLARLLKLASGMQPSGPLDPKTSFGAMASREQFERVMGYIDTARAEGGELLAGGVRLHTGSNGFYIGPTVFDIQPTMTLAKEEVFGPVLGVLTFRTEAEAVSLANDSIYGLAASVWGADYARNLSVARRIKAGTVWVNTYDEVDMSTPFGGYKQSGFGRDRSAEALHKYTQIKTIWMNVKHKAAA